MLWIAYHLSSKQIYILGIFLKFCHYCITSPPKASVKVRSILWYMIILGSTKFLQSGCPNIWQRSTSAIAWTSAPVFWSGAVVKVITSWNLGTSLWTRNQTAEHTMEAHGISDIQKIQVAARCRKAHADSVLGLPRAYHWTLFGARYHGKKCKVLRHAKEWTEAGYSHKTERKVVTGCCSVTQCAPSYGSPHRQHPLITELGSSRAPSPQPRLGAFRFPSVWTPQERSERSSICRWSEVKEAVHDWLCNELQNFLFSNGIKKLA
jgi:hypothetical protein